MNDTEQWLNRNVTGSNRDDQQARIADLETALALQGQLGVDSAQRLISQRDEALAALRLQETMTADAAAQIEELTGEVTRLRSTVTRMETSRVEVSLATASAIARLRKDRDGWEKDFGTLARERDALRAALDVARGLVIRHHEASFRPLCGQFCSVCHRTDGSEPEMDQIAAALASGGGMKDEPDDRCDCGGPEDFNPSTPGELTSRGCTEAYYV